MIAKAFDYETGGSPRSWTQVMAARHALAKFPDCKFLWLLDQHSYIMDPTRSLEDQVLNSKVLDSLMIKDHPVVPPDSIIHTFSHLKAADIDLIVAQDRGGLNTGSVLLRNGDWANFFLETWLDPLYRSYNFQKAERHALVRFHLFSHAKLHLADVFRNTWSNGIPLFFRASLWCRSRGWGPMPTRIRVRPIFQATLLLCLVDVALRVAAAASRSRNNT